MWYTDRNSVIVAPTEEDIAQTVAEMNRGSWDRASIREDALNLRAGFWDVLLGELQQIFCRHGIELDAAEYARRHFVHKMGL